MWCAIELLPIQQTEVPFLAFEIKALVSVLSYFKTEEISFLIENSELRSCSSFEVTSYRLP